MKTALKVDSEVSATSQLSGAALVDELPCPVRAGNGRFPPVENALSEIVNNKRFVGAMKES